MLRLPLDDFWSDVHLAPYAFVGFGCFDGSSELAEVQHVGLSWSIARQIATSVRQIPRTHDRLGHASRDYDNPRLDEFRKYLERRCCVLRNTSFVCMQPKINRDELLGAGGRAPFSVVA
jgi:hypothetical protein